MPRSAKQSGPWRPVKPSRALCLKLAGTPHADKPLAGMCDSARCPQATHHPGHRPVWAEHAEKTKAFIGGLGPTRITEKTRLQAEYDRATRVLAEICYPPLMVSSGGQVRAFGDERGWVG